MVWSQEVDVGALLNAMQLGVVVHRSDTTIIDANPRALELLNLTRDQILGAEAINTDWHFIDESGAPMAPADYPVNRVARLGEPIRNYKVGVVDSGRANPTWVSCNAYPSEHNDRIVVTFVDITETEEANRSLAKSLRAEEESKLRLLGTTSRLEIALAAISAHTYDWDVGTGEIVFDEDLSPVLGYPAGSLQRIDLEQLGGLTHSGDLNKRSKGLRALINGDISTYQNTARLKHRDGHWVWVENRSKVLARDDTGTPTHCVGVLIDITERRELEAALLRSQKLEALGTLAGGIAHDFNNLLTPILGYSELVKRSLPEESKAHGYIDHVRKAAERAKQLVLNILLISRSGSADKEPLSLASLIEEVLVVVRASSPKALVIDTDLPDDIPTVDADAAKIYQVILNLCTNAVQAMSDQGHLSVRLDYSETAPSIPDHQQSAEGYVVMVIEDDGSGIPPETLEQIFDPFFTTKLKGERRGTGLGLSIVDSVIKDHDGTVEVASQPSVGTRFTIYLPATSRPETRALEVHKHPLTVPHARVMLVDDEEMVRALGEAMLTHLGCTVMSFADGVSALASFSRAPDDFDIVLTDYEMPEMSGIELLGHLRKIRGEIPVLLLTGYANLTTEEKRAELGFDGVLAKPYGEASLRAALVSIFKQRSD